jgi:hypothetical protein
VALEQVQPAHAHLGGGGAPRTQERLELHMEKQASVRLPRLASACDVTVTLTLGLSTAAGSCPWGSSKKSWRVSTSATRPCLLRTAWALSVANVASAVWPSRPSPDCRSAGVRRPFSTVLEFGRSSLIVPSTASAVE